MKPSSGSEEEDVTGELRDQILLLQDRLSEMDDVILAQRSENTLLQSELADRPPLHSESKRRERPHHQVSRERSGGTRMCGEEHRS